MTEVSVPMTLEGLRCTADLYWSRGERGGPHKVIRLRFEDLKLGGVQYSQVVAHLEQYLVHAWPSDGSGPGEMRWDWKQPDCSARRTERGGTMTENARSRIYLAAREAPALLHDHLWARALVLYRSEALRAAQQDEVAAAQKTEDVRHELNVAYEAERKALVAYQKENADILHSIEQKREVQP